MVAAYCKVFDYAQTWNYRMYLKGVSKKYTLLCYIKFNIIIDFLWRNQEYL